MHAKTRSGYYLDQYCQRNIRNNIRSGKMSDKILSKEHPAPYLSVNAKTQII